MSYAVFVMGPAGSGKSTLCAKLIEHCKNTKRNVHLINLDPAQVDVNTAYSVDIRDMVTVTDIMEQTDFGPNGALMHAFSEINDNFDKLNLEDYLDSYLLFDLPGQIELYIHSEPMLMIIDKIKSMFNCCILFINDGQFMMDDNRFLSSCLTNLISMARIELPFINVVTKTDIFKFDEDYYDKIDVSKLNSMNKRIHEFLSVRNMTNFESVGSNTSEIDMAKILYLCDDILQYHENKDVKMKL